jgi:hypothetical protein
VEIETERGGGVDGRRVRVGAGAPPPGPARLRGTPPTRPSRVSEAPPREQAERSGETMASRGGRSHRRCERGQGKWRPGEGGARA